MNEQTNGQTKVPCSTGLCPLWGRCSASSHSNLQWCKVGQRVSLTTYCPWATYWLLHIHNYNIFAFKPYFGEIWSVLNSFLMVHWSCAKFPALLPCFPPLKYTVKQSRAMGIANRILPLSAFLYLNQVCSALKQICGLKKALKQQSHHPWLEALVWIGALGVRELISRLKEISGLWGLFQRL